jgi:hypothetical protein
MGLIEILWTVAGITVPLLLGTAWAMIGLSPPEFLIARVCVGVAAAIFLGTSLVWLVLMEWSTGARIFVAALLGAISLIVFSESFRLIGARENLLIAQTIDKRKAIRAQLQQFYIQLGNLLDQSLPKDISQEDFDKYKQDASEIVNGVAQWIKANMGDAALARFTDRSGMSDVHYPLAVNDTHNLMLMNQTRFRQNILALIESSAWDKP